MGDAENDVVRIVGVRDQPLSVDEVLRMGRYAARGLVGRLRRDDHDAIDAAATRLEVDELRHRSFGDLSGGQRQRVLVAQALASQPGLLLLDEPITGLDLPSQARILEVVHDEVTRGGTVVLSTHHLGEARRTDRVMLLAGCVVADGPPATVLQREHLAEAAAEASALIELADPSRPMHVGAVLGNTPAMLRSMAAAALGGYVLCGINTTRRGDGLAADIRRSDCQLVLADAEHMPLLDDVELSGAQVLDVGGRAYRDPVEAAKPLVPHREAEGVDPVVMLFTSGTSGDPKAVRFAHAMAVREELGLPKSAVEFQLLYGMADEIKAALVGRGERVRVYAPVGRLLPGMAYLVRRLLENTSNDSFLRAGFLENVPEETLLMNPLKKVHREDAKDAK